MIANTTPSTRELASARGKAVAAVIEHDGLRPAAGLRSLERAPLNDQQRFGVLLQGAALLAHLERSGCRLSADGWQGCGVDSDGILRGLSAEAGRDPVPPQTRLRQLLLALFDARGEIAGRGHARRIARLLLETWDQELERSLADDEVARILDEAPFLWQEQHANNRRALIAVSRASGEEVVVVAGPRSWRRAVLEHGATFGAATSAAAMSVALVASVTESGARELWIAGCREDPVDLIRRGRWNEALRVYSVRQPPLEERGSYLECLLAAGRYQQALHALDRPRSQPERVRKIDCQYQLHRLEAARRGLAALESQELSPEVELELADIALRVHANLGNKSAAKSWIVRCRKLARGQRSGSAYLIAAFGAWDSQDREGMARYLEAALAARDDVAIAWRYHHARALFEVSWGDPRAALEAIERAVIRGRGRLKRVDWGRLWNDVVLVRVMNDDLVGAERACRFALRMLSGCEGPISTTLGYRNLAEIRVRRGRLSRARKLIERSGTYNRQSDNVRGIAEDTELLARLALAEGRLEEALEIAESGLERLERDGTRWRDQELALLCARILGLLGRERRAAHYLDGVASPDLGCFEPEERALLFAHAGQRERALVLARGILGERLIEAVLAGKPLAAAEWEAALEPLEPYRAARLVRDLHQLAPDLVPDSWRRRAAVVLSRCGASRLAERLRGRGESFWSVLTVGLANPGVEAAARLLAAAGHPDAVLSVREGYLGDERVLVGRDGGPYRAELERGGCSWRLDSPSPDERLSALAALAGMVALPEREGPRGSRSPAARRHAATSGMIGEGAELLRAIDRIERLGAGELPILVLGETGTGKELAARHVHRVSARQEGPFLAVNCAAMSETLGLSDLFGHVRGAFTGADKDHAGVFESAKRGTVFLDEIGDLPAAAQGMMLRVLQEGEIRRLGESHPRPVDVRIVAATHRDLEQMVEQGSFRADLFYRLGVGQVRLPPLRERGQDCLVLAEHFLAELGGGNLSAEAQRRVISYHWPGNIRQLRGLLAGAVALAGRHGAIEVEHLELPQVEAQAPYHEWLERLKRERIRVELERCGGNQSEAARRLGLSRQALSYLVRQLGLS